MVLVCLVRAGMDQAQGVVLEPMAVLLVRQVELLRLNLILVAVAVAGTLLLVLMVLAVRQLWAAAAVVRAVGKVQRHPTEAAPLAVNLVVHHLMRQQAGQIVA